MGPRGGLAKDHKKYGFFPEPFPNGYETIDGRLWQMALVHPSELEYDGNGKCQSGGQSGMN